MISFSHVIKDAEGLHARPSALIAAAALKLDSEVTVTLGERSVLATDPVGLMTLDALCGDTLLVRIEGGDEEASAEAMRQVIAF